MRDKIQRILHILIPQLTCLRSPSTPDKYLEGVIIPVHTQHYMMLQRNLLYTGITRGRKLVVIVGTKKVVAMAVKRVESHGRVTLLKERLDNQANHTYTSD